MTDTSFYVHLKSLRDFARELETQLQGILGPAGQLDSLQGTPILLGAFGEASELSQAHQAAAQEMQELLGQVKQAIGFAENVTKVVASGYEQADQSAASGMGGGSGSGASGHGHSHGHGQMGPSGYPSTPAAQVIGSVGSVVTGLNQYVNGAVNDVTNGVTQVVDGLFNSGGTPT